MGSSFASARTKAMALCGPGFFGGLDCGIEIELPRIFIPYKYPVDQALVKLFQPGLNFRGFVNDVDRGFIFGMIAGGFGKIQVARRKSNLAVVFTMALEAEGSRPAGPMMLLCVC